MHHFEDTQLVVIEFIIPLISHQLTAYISIMKCIRLSLFTGMKFQRSIYEPKLFFKRVSSKSINDLTTIWSQYLLSQTLTFKLSAIPQFQCRPVLISPYGIASNKTSLQLKRLTVFFL